MAAALALCMAQALPRLLQTSGLKYGKAPSELQPCSHLGVVQTSGRWTSSAVRMLRPLVHMAWQHMLTWQCHQSVSFG